MIVSMTSYGTATETTSVGTVHVEIKTVNSRYFECLVRVPNTLTAFEIPVRQLIRPVIRRGKVDVTIRWEESAELQPRVTVNEKMLLEIHTQMCELARKLDVPASEDLTPLLQLPNIITAESAEIDEDKVWRPVSSLVEKALEKCRQFRVREGKVLKRQINDSLKRMRQYHREISEHKDSVVDMYRERLKKRIDELTRSEDIVVNTERLEAEVLFYADKADISEELTRLKAHLGGFRKYLAPSHEGQVGKALDFLSQEILREVNTIASKARDTEIATRVLLMKNEVEKIREQVQNIE